jgi:hypothetical protein
MFHHLSTVSALPPHTKHFYKVGSQSNTTFTSDVDSFVTARASSDDNTFNMVVYGDFPEDESRDTLTYMSSLSSGEEDFVYHIGGVGCANSTVGTRSTRVDSSQELVNCCCREPTTLNAIHRTVAPRVKRLGF